MKEEFQSYEDSLKYYCDLKNSLDMAFDEGREEEKLYIAHTAIQKRYDNTIISDLTGLSEGQIEKLRKKV